VGVTIVLGLISILKAVQSLFNINLIERKLVFNITGLITIFFSAYIFRKVFIVRKSLTNRK
jgi:hypothetical protein